MSRGYETHPERNGAPLPENGHMIPPTLNELCSELRRAEIELMYAIAKHRKGWQAMRRRQKERELLADRPGMLSYLDTDEIWKVATGDVNWWRSEMTAQATTITALTKIIEAREAEIRE